ncbi:Embryo-specific protein [Pseudozyma hubeiensis]|nr:Embryo-specific protein [Pseudozyma hubeiensis]
MVNRFAPVDKIHQALHAYHVVADERGEVVSSVHYCSCSATGDHFQCLIYESDDPDAKLIGVEYMIPEHKFLQLPEDEKKYWHSHVYEVMSGSLVLIGLRVGTVADAAAGALKSAEDALKSIAGPGATGGAVPDAAEMAALAKVKKLYGKAIHLWHPPSSDVPLGPPRLMMPTDPKYGGAPDDMIKQRDERYGIDTELKKQQRQQKLTESFVPNSAADQYAHSGKTPQFTSEERQVRPPN